MTWSMSYGRAVIEYLDIIVSVLYNLEYEYMFTLEIISMF